MLLFWVFLSRTFLTGLFDDGKSFDHTRITKLEMRKRLVFICKFAINARPSRGNLRQVFNFISGGSVGSFPWHDWRCAPTLSENQGQNRGKMVVSSENDGGLGKLVLQLQKPKFWEEKNRWYPFVECVIAGRRPILSHLWSFHSLYHINTLLEVHACCNQDVI